MVVGICFVFIDVYSHDLSSIGYCDVAVMDRAELGYFVENEEHFRGPPGGLENWTGEA